MKEILTVEQRMRQGEAKQINRACKEGKIMGKIQECASCGRVPVAESTLCVDCLAACNIGRKYQEKEIEKLRYQLRLNQKILRHIFREYQELQKLKAVDIVA